MKYELQDSLGADDARYINNNYAAGLPLDAAKLAKGCTVDLPDAAADWLRDVRGYKALLEPASVRGRAKDAEIHAVPPKSKGSKSDE